MRLVAYTACIIAVLEPGALYGLGLLAAPLAASYNVNVDAIGRVQGVAFFFVACGAAIGGPLIDRFGPRYVAIVGAVLWGIANVSTGFLLPSLGALALYGVYAVVGGLGAGLVYNAALATAMSIFSGRRGLAGGSIVGAFALGGIAFDAIVSARVRIGDLSDKAAAFFNARTSALVHGATFNPKPYALSSTDMASLDGIFVWSGIVFAVVGVLAGWFLVTTSADADADAADAIGPARLVRGAQFYVLTALLFLNVTAGAIVVLNGSAALTELANTDAASVAPILVVLALVAALGSLVWGALTDIIGGRAVFITILALQVAGFFEVSYQHDLTLLGVGFGLISFGYGGMLGAMPGYAAYCFGLSRIASNYGLISLGRGFAELIGPLFAGLIVGTTGSLAAAVQPAAIMLAVAMIFPIIAEAQRFSGRQVQSVPIEG